MVNIEFIEAGIKNLIRTNYELDPQNFDINSMIDPKLTFSENWDKIKPKVLQKLPKKIKYQKIKPL